MRPRAALALLATAAAAATVAFGPAAWAQPAEGAASPAVPPPLCEGWTARVVADGFGPLENLAVLPDGALLVSEAAGSAPSGGAVWRVEPGVGRRLVAAVPSPGGIVVEGPDTAYVTFGNSLTAGLLGQPTGGIARLGLADGSYSTIATGLVMPNGLAALPGGRFVTTRDSGIPDHPTLIEADGGHRPFAPWLTSSNGVVRDDGSGDLYVTRTFTDPGEVVRISEDGRLLDRYPFAGFGPLVAADDLGLAPDGMLYVAQNTGARVVRIDPHGGRQCVVADDLWLPSSVRARDANTLFVTSFRGTVTELRRG